MAGPSITEHEELYVLDALRNGWYGKNAYYYVELFEAEFAKYHGRKYALMTPNCTTAIHLALAAMRIGRDDEVIAPECTWIGSTAAINYEHATPVFADIDPVHWCLTAETIEARITDATKAVIVVDLYGNMPNWHEIEQLCHDRGLWLIEDAAEAIGSKYHERRAGSFGDASVFSFHRTKTMTTGEGGMLVLDDDRLYERCKFLRDHGRKPGSYLVEEVAFKYMPCNLLAALGLAQFRRLDELVEKKRQILHGYKNQLSQIPDLQFNHEPNSVYNSAWNTAIVFGPSHNMTRDKAMAKLAEKNIPARPFFYPLSSLPAYDIEQWGRARNPTAYDISERGINVPSPLNLTDDELALVCDGIRSLVTQRVWI